MNITENQKESSALELTIALERADIQKDLEKAARHIGAHTNIPGFRAGTAPYGVLCRHIGGESKIYEEAAQSIVARTLYEAVRMKNIETFGPPKIAIKKMVPGFGITYSATLMLLPRVELGDISTISLPDERMEVDAKEVEKVIDELRTMRATEAEVARAIRTGDKAVIDFKIMREGVVIEGGSATRYPLLVGEGRFIPGFEDALIGLKKGDTKAFDLTFPKEYHEKSLAGKKAQCVAAVHQVFERTLPELDDAFAKGVQHDSVAQLREAIHKNIQHEKEQELKEKTELKAMEALVACSTVGPIPASMIEDEVDKMMHELEHSVSHQGMRYDNYLKSIKKTEEELRKEFAPKAEHRLKIGLVAREFGKHEHLEVSDEEVEKEIEVSKKAYANEPDTLKRFESDDYKAYVRNVLSSKKTFEALVEKATKK